jgi:hypothetical protein
MIVDNHPLPVSDLNSAVAYYNRQRPGLGDEFHSKSTQVTIDRILSNPYQFPAVEHAIRGLLPHGELNNYRGSRVLSI